MIEVTNLTKRYGDHIAVDHLSFTVEKGQIYGFLGPNGAGKSTTMNMLTGYLAPSGGTVTVDGVDIQKEPETAKEKIGYLPEIPPLYVDMTVKEYLDFVAELKKVPKKDRAAKVSEVMAMTGTEEYSRRLIRNLSKGYKQRVGLAQAILGDPDVLILDEPTVGLDPKQIIEIRELIRMLGQTHTIILSSHILTEVSAVCDHVLIIARGKLVASDTPEGLQKLMSGDTQILLSVAGPEDEVKSALLAVEGVAEVTVEGHDTDQNTKYRVSCAENKDLRKELSLALASQGYPVMGMSLKQKSLEDIFIELTEDVQPTEVKKRGLFGRKKKDEKAPAGIVMEENLEVAAEEKAAPDESASIESTATVDAENNPETSESVEETTSPEGKEEA